MMANFHNPNNIMVMLSLVIGIGNIQAGDVSRSVLIQRAKYCWQIENPANVACARQLTKTGHPVTSGRTN
jgi:hypothetical protein